MDYNRIAWVLIFLLGTAIFSWIEWAGVHVSFMGWFLLTSVWSAVCGIGYSVMDWLIQNKNS